MYILINKSGEVEKEEQSGGLCPEGEQPMMTTIWNEISPSLRHDMKAKNVARHAEEKLRQIFLLSTLCRHA